MISAKEVKKLADLARIEVAESELQGLAGEMDAILEYVGQVSEVAGSDIKNEIEEGQIHNVMREDENPTEPEAFSQEVIAEFPRSEKNYLKVKKIL